MKRALAALSILMLSGCTAFDPAAMLREAAKEVHFTLEKVSPRLELAFPLDQSRLVLDLDLGVQNDSGQRFRTRTIGGALNLATHGASHDLGTVSFPEGLDITSQSHSNLHAQVSLSYGQVREAWGAIRSSVVDHEPATWSLDGTAHLDLLGMDVVVPFKTSKGTGR